MRFPAARVQTAIRACAILATATFITADVISASGWDWRSWLPAFSKHGRNDEIRSYVEFVEVNYRDNLTVQTGIQYASSYTREIQSQWCYLRRKILLPGMAENSLTLASAKDQKPATINFFTSENLRPFSLTLETASELVTTHCRFK